MITTLQIDSCGNLHAFEGNVQPYRVSGLLYEVDGKEAEVFINDWEVEHALDCLTEDERDMLNRGYSITTNNFPSDYFIQG